MLRSGVMRRLLFVLVATALPLIAQDPGATEPGRADALAQSRERLQKVLQRAAALTDTRFEASWGPDRKPKAEGNQRLVQLLGRQQSGEVRGSWHPGLDHLTFADEQQDEFLLSGRRMLARSKNDDWVPRAARFADGNEVDFLPDVPALLRQLADWPLAITHRDVGMLDDMPVEILSITLNDDQVTAAVWSGLLPPALTTFFSAGVFQVAMGGGQGRRPATRPEATIDLAVTFDPATSMLRRLQFRGYTSQARLGGRVVVAGAGGQLRLGGNDEGGEEDEEIDEDAPLQYVDGLPKRPRKNKSVCDFTLRLFDQGQVAAPELSEKQRKLLGL